MNIYFDCEFTGLHKDTTLISIGFVAENGKTFYAEFMDYDKRQCNTWIEENVIRYLYLPKGTQSVNGSIRMRGDSIEIRNELIKWYSQYNIIQFVSDVCHYDMVLLIDLFGTSFDLPKNVNASCHDINQDIAAYSGISEKLAFNYSREEFLKDRDIDIEGNKHNALYDAKVIKAIYKIVNGV